MVCVFGEFFCCLVCIFVVGVVEGDVGGFLDLLSEILVGLIVVDEGEVGYGSSFWRVGRMLLVLVVIVRFV